MNYKELLFNKDKTLTFYPELAVILNRYDEIECERHLKEKGKPKKPSQNGLNKAIIINQINYWNEINEKAKRNFKDGYYWTYHTYDGWAKEDFPFWSGDTVKRAILPLEEIGIVVSANYNQFKVDKTKWYRIDYKRLQEVIDSVCNNYKSKEQVAPKESADCGTDRASCTDEQVNEHRTIPEITPETTNRDYKDNSLSGERASESEPPKQKKQSRKKEANELFERIWKLYPKKLGKGKTSDTQKLKLLEIGYDELSRAIQRCCAYNKDKDMQYWQNGSTFFNSGYIDFLDENYEDSSSPKVESMGEVQKEPLSEKEKIRLGIEKAREIFGDDYGESYWSGMDDSNIIITLEYLGIRVDEL